MIDVWILNNWSQKPILIAKEVQKMFRLIPRPAAGRGLCPALHCGIRFTLALLTQCVNITAPVIAVPFTVVNDSCINWQQSHLACLFTIFLFSTVMGKIPHNAICNQNPNHHSKKYLKSKSKCCFKMYVKSVITIPSRDFTSAMQNPSVCHHWCKCCYTVAELTACFLDVFHKYRLSI